MVTAFENQIESIRSRLAGSRAGEFFRWWFGELRELLPPALKAKMQHAQRRILVQVFENEISISVQEADSRQEIEVLPRGQDANLQRQQLHDLLQERELLEVSRELLLPDSGVLRKEVILPIAAESNLRQALSFEMDRQTPFQSSDVFFDYRIVQRDRENSQLRVDLAVSLKQPVLNQIEELTPLGLAPSGVDVELDQSPAAMNLLPPELRYRVVNKRSRVNIILSLAFLALMAAIMLQSLWLRQHQIDEVQAAIDEVRSEAMQVQQVRDRIADATEAAGFMLGQKSGTSATVQILAEVTRILPDDTFLDRLLIDSESVQMQGKSENAQQLIELVNASPLFSDAEFRGPTRMDTRTQKEIFDVTAMLETGEEG
jgi:general secretion pathway protein L